MKTLASNCIICGEEYNKKELKQASLSIYDVCKNCVAKSDPQNDYLEVRKIIKSYKQDPEVISPTVKIEPVDSLIQKAVDLLKKIDPNYFVGVRKIIVETSSGYGYVGSGANQDPTIIHINLPRIKSEIQSKYTGNNAEEAIVRSIATTIAHEKGHIKSYKEQTGFTGGEGPAQVEEKSIEEKIDRFLKLI